MFRLILKRLLLLIPVLIGVTFLVFAILSLAPGDPVLVVLGDNATEEAAEAMRSELGLDKPFLERYTRPSMTCFNYFFNLIDEDRPTYDLKVRQAICYAIDRQKIIDTILQGSATLADSMIAPIVACYTPTPTYDYDLEKAKQYIKKGKMEVRGDTCRQELYRVKKDEKFRRAVVVRDTVNKTIHVDVDRLAPKGSLTVNLGILKTQRLVDAESFVYRLSGYEKVGQSELLAYRSVIHEKDRSLGILPNMTIDYWKFVEFYPFEAEFLTHKEYREDKKSVKDSEMTFEDIDRIKKAINVPALSPEIEQKLSETMQWFEKQKKNEN